MYVDTPTLVEGLWMYGYPFRLLQCHTFILKLHPIMLAVVTNLSSDNSGLLDTHVVFGVLLALGALYHVAMLLLGRCPIDERPHEELSFDQAFLSHIMVCPKRRQRYIKCARRCRKRQQKEADPASSDDTGRDETSTCSPSWVMQHLGKIHLPPPLPFVRRRRRGICMFVSCCNSGMNQDVSAASEKSASTVSVSLEEGSSSSFSLSSGRDTSLQDVASSSAPSPSLPRSTLLDLVRMQQWESILNHPNRGNLLSRKNAKFCDADGLYPLHWACSGGPPVAIIQALLEAYPSAARKVDSEGSTALHFACHYSALPAVIQALISVYPLAAKKQDKYGRTPLYHAVDKSASLAVLKTLMNVAPEAGTTPCLPKQVRRECGQEVTRDMAVRTPLFMAWAVALDGRNKVRAKSIITNKAFCKAKLLLEQCSRQSSLLGSAIALDLYLPAGVLPLLLEKHSPPKEDDLDILSVAATTASYSPERARIIWDSLLNRFSANVRNASGESPLSLALVAGKTWNVLRPLFFAAPEAIHWKDCKTGLPPALLAASSSFTDCSSSGVTSHAEPTTTTYPSQRSHVSKWLEQNDPYRLLTRKNREVLREENTPSARVPNGLLPDTSDTTLAQLETIYELLQADTTVLLANDSY